MDLLLWKMLFNCLFGYFPELGFFRYMCCSLGPSMLGEPGAGRVGLEKTRHVLFQILKTVSSILELRNKKQLFDEVLFPAQNQRI